MSIRSVIFCARLSLRCAFPRYGPESKPDSRPLWLSAAAGSSSTCVEGQGTSVHSMQQHERTHPRSKNGPAAAAWLRFLTVILALEELEKRTGGVSEAVHEAAR